MTECTCDPKQGDCCECDVCHRYLPREQALDIARRIATRDAELLKRLADG
jgi:hypothetical protein